MNSRERVLAATNHIEPDRIPLFAPNMINTTAPYDPGLLRYLDEFPFDHLASVGGLVNPPTQQVDVDDDQLIDGYGCRFQYKGVGMPYCIHSPLAGAQTVADIEAFDWPDPEAPSMIASDASERAARARGKEEQVLQVGISHIFHQYHYMRGFEQWMIDVRLHRDVHRAIADHILHINSTLAMRLLEQVGEHTDMVSINDDLGTSVAPYMSPADFRELVKPYYTALLAPIKARHPHIKVYMHSHGQIMDLVPDLIECGVDVLNPILPLDNMDPVQLKREYGDRLCFHGGIDIEHIVPFGTVDEVRDHVKEVIDILAPGGGYWFKAQAISPVIPPENIIAAYECAIEYGRYAE